MDANQLLLGSAGGRGASFPRVGTIVKGKVLSEPEAREQTEPATGEVKRFKDGAAKMQVLIRLQTDLREDPEDDGVRTVYAKGQMLKAIGRAMQEVKARKIEPDGFLEVGLVGEEPPTIRGFNPTKLYAARYTPPAANTLLSAAAEAPAATDSRVGMSTLEQLQQMAFNAQGKPQSPEMPF